MPAGDYTALRKQISLLDIAPFSGMQSQEPVTIVLHVVSMTISLTSTYCRGRLGKNSVLATKSEARRGEGDMYRCLGHETWAEEKGYGRRQSVETAYSTFKRTFGESVMVKTMAKAVKEGVAKASIYNVLVHM